MGTKGVFYDPPPLPPNLSCCWFYCAPSDSQTQVSMAVTSGPKSPFWLSGRSGVRVGVRAGHSTKCMP